MRTSNIILVTLAALLATAVIVGVTGSATGTSSGGEFALAGVRGERSYGAMPLRHLRVAGPIKVILAAGSPSTRIEADEALLDALADGDPDPEVLAIELPRGVRLAAGDEIIAHVTTPTLEEVSLSGRVSLRSEASLPYGANEISASGSCDIDLAYDAAESIGLESSGSSEVDLRGSARTLVARFSGSGDLDAGDLAARVVRVSSSGSASSIVRADSLLVVESSGSGEVGYYGRPLIEFENSGSGSVRAL